MAHDNLPEPPSWLVSTILAVLRHASIRAELAAAMAEVASAPSERPELLTPDELCSQLRISRSKLDSLLSSGLPHVMVGSVRRFRLVEVIEHLRARDEEQAA